MYISKCSDSQWRHPRENVETNSGAQEKCAVAFSSTLLHAPVADTFYWISCANAVKRTGAENPKDPQADLNLDAEMGYLLA